MSDVPSRSAAALPAPPPSPDGAAIAFAVRDLGLVPYDQALAIQDETARARLAGAGGDTLLLLEHPHVVTLGRNAREENVLLPEAELARRGVLLRPSSRGGDVTYHGPGQLVGWPVFLIPPARRDVHRYVRDVEEALIRALATFAITAGREPGLTGVWVDGAKVAALGVRISRWVTTHGFALNVSTDLDYFRLITPCGLVGRPVTSMARLLGAAPDLAEVKREVARRFVEVFQSGAQTALPSSCPRTPGS